MAQDQMTTATIGHLALKLLIELLFYSSPQGPRRLWMALLSCEGTSSAKMKPTA